MEVTRLNISYSVKNKPTIIGRIAFGYKLPNGNWKVKTSDGVVKEITTSEINAIFPQKYHVDKFE